MAVPKLSIVVPLYNEEQSLEILADWIHQVMQNAQLSYELIFVDDGSDDLSWRVIEKIEKKYPQRVRALSFLRNYGKSAALHMGFQVASAEVIITIDADLQDSPDEMPALYEMIAKGGYDLVSGWKRRRQDSFIKVSTSRFFNWVTARISGIDLHDFNCGLKAYRADLVKMLYLQGDMHRYLPLLAKWNGFPRITEKSVAHYPRKYGKSKYGWDRFIHGFLDLLSISFVEKFKRRPMHFFGFWGTMCFLFGAFIACYLVGQKLYRLSEDLPARDVVDQPLFYFALVGIVVGMQMFLAGFLAEMTASALNKTNTNREYIVKKQL